VCAALGAGSGGSPTPRRTRAKCVLERAADRALEAASTEAHALLLARLREITLLDVFDGAKRELGG
jgi:hypothetical protein